MLTLPKNGCLSFDNTHMDYISFGSGPKTLIMLPGLGDGLRGVRGLSLPFSLLYRQYSKSHRVYVFSRKRSLAPGCTTRDMADDVAKAMQLLHLEKADILGVSHGGMLAQQLAIHHPDKVNKLILVVTAARRDPHVDQALSRWCDFARQGRHRELMTDTMKAMYSPAYVKHNSWTIPLVSLVSKPRTYDRFLAMADAGLRHDCFSQLSLIHSPTLVIGGELDKVVSPQASRDLAANIPGAQLHLFPQWGHGLYEEAPDYTDLVLTFLNQEQ